ncbi:MAG: NAD-binding protein, partial [Nitrospinota bacterium]|nr:NAD-binding protein [Nitrospinota bacterium]
AYSKQMDQKGEKMIQGDTSPESRLTISLKDSRFILEQGRSLGVPLFTTSLYSQIAQIGAETGYADLDPAALVEVLREMAGLPRRK